jgi:poly-beta-1,6-N-acetyl-D-glucosamine synthase
MNQRLLVISPCRDEEQFIETTIRSVINQTQRPDLWIIVDDGSKDATPAIVSRYADQHPWIKLLPHQPAGSRKMGSGVINAFNAGLSSVNKESYDIIVKLDGDLEFGPDCFANILADFEDPRVGMVGGVILTRLENGQLVHERYQHYHIPGATKFYRRECFNDIKGPQSIYGWDILDETDARRHGWITITNSKSIFFHHRVQGAAFGVLRGRIIWGQCAYAIGSHPFFALFRGLYRMAERPWIIGGLAFLWGFFSGYLNRNMEKISDRELIRYVQSEQLYRLFHNNRLPPGK